MDALDVIVHPEEIEAWFQPIVGAAPFKVEGYEIQSHFRGEPLKPFFQEDDVPIEYQLEVMGHVVRQAFQKVPSDAQAFILIRCRPAWLFENGGEDFLHVLRTVDSSFPKERMYVTLTDVQVDDFDRLGRIVAYYQNSGLKVALDRAEATSLERVFSMSPDMLIVDLSSMIEKKTVSASYPHLLQTMEHLCDQLGAPLLYKNISHLGQLRYAWQHGGRYYMGNLLGEASPEWVMTCPGMEVLIHEVPMFYKYDREQMNRLFQLEQDWTVRFNEDCQSLKPEQDLDQWLLTLARKMEPEFIRFYITDANGFQQSSNVSKKSGEWKLYSFYKGYNWSFRPYFIRTTVAMERRHSGYLSERYVDFSSSEQTRTFSMPLGNGMFLFADISADYLYQERLSE
ncbi:EAL-associated domain-containing protein [Exiguobacterium indicum]|uniref:EAL-associated domain-containing protein n=1 Tax=Exiguobacterium TaxID=33986 RepID=UPI00049481B9|nr:EAL-associated domain-containing protein [Exiguobacterium acetylicum]